MPKSPGPPPPPPAPAAWAAGAAAGSAGGCWKWARVLALAAGHQRQNTRQVYQRQRGLWIDNQSKVLFENTGRLLQQVNCLGIGGGCNMQPGDPFGLTIEDHLHRMACHGCCLRLPGDVMHAWGWVHGLLHTLPLRMQQLYACSVLNVCGSAITQLLLLGAGGEVLLPPCRAWKVRARMLHQPTAVCIA